MTKKRAEFLTGYEIRRLPGSSGFWFAAFDGETLVAEAVHADESIALRRLLRAVYHQHRETAFERQNWRCARCGRSWALQAHHRRFRSHGGTHRVENLEPVCWECHDRIHRSERSQ